MKSFIACVFIATFCFFQNFNTLPIAKLKPQFVSAQARAMAMTDERADMRHLAPDRPSDFDKSGVAQPQSGSDLNSISQDWVTRQTHLITGGAEQRFLEDVNKRMTRMLKWEEIEGEPYPEAEQPSGSGRGPASVPNDDNEDEYYGMKPTSLRMLAINRVQVGFSNNTKVSCSIEGPDVKWDLSRSLNKNFDVNVRHEPANNKNTVHLNYSW